MDGQVAHLPPSGMAVFLCLRNCTFQGNTHIPKGAKAGFRIEIRRPVLGQNTGFQLEHRKTQHIGRFIQIAAFSVNDPDSGIIGDENVDLTPYIHTFCVQSFLNAFTDIVGNGEFLETQLLKNKVDFVFHISFSSYIGR